MNTDTFIKHLMVLYKVNSVKELIKQKPEIEETVEILTRITNKRES